MSKVTAKMRKRVEMQGFVGCTDGEVCELNRGLRFAPAICCAWTAVGVAFASPWIIAGLIPFALLGGILRSHPFDVFYNHGFRYLIGANRLPRYPIYRRMTCMMASALLAITALGFYFESYAIGYGFGGSMVVASFINVTTGFCIPSFIYGVIFGKPSRVAPA